MKKILILTVFLFVLISTYGQARIKYVVTNNIFYALNANDLTDTLYSLDTLNGLTFRDATFMKIGFSYYPTSGLWVPVWDAAGDSLAWGEMEIGGGSLDTLFFTDNKFIKEGYTYYPTSGLWSPVYDADGDSLTWGEMEIGGGSGTPGGSSGDIQYNNSGSFGGAPMTTDGTDITVTNNISADTIIPNTIKKGDSYFLDFTQTNKFAIRDNSEDVVFSIINYNDGTGDFMSFESDYESMMRIDGTDSSCTFQGVEFRFENMTGNNQLQITPATSTKCLFAVTGYITADSIVTTLGTSDWVFENREDWSIKDHKDFTNKNNHTPEMGKARGMSIGRNIEALEAELEKAYIFIYELEERLRILENK